MKPAKRWAKRWSKRQLPDKYRNAPRNSGLNSTPFVNQYDDLTNGVNYNAKRESEQETHGRI